jgi:hypothetical protein
LAYDIATPIHAQTASRPKRPAVMSVFRVKFFFCKTTPIRNDKVVQLPDMPLGRQERRGEADSDAKITYIERVNVLKELILRRPLDFCSHL